MIAVIARAPIMGKGENKKCYILNGDDNDSNDDLTKGAFVTGAPASHTTTGEPNCIKVVNYAMQHHLHD